MPDNDPGHSLRRTLGGPTQNPDDGDLVVALENDQAAASTVDPTDHARLRSVAGPEHEYQRRDGRGRRECTQGLEPAGGPGGLAGRPLAPGPTPRPLDVEGRQTARDPLPQVGRVGRPIGLDGQGAKPTQVFQLALELRRAGQSALEPPAGETTISLSTRRSWTGDRRRWTACCPTSRKTGNAISPS